MIFSMALEMPETVSSLSNDFFFASFSTSGIKILWFSHPLRRISMGAYSCGRAHYWQPRTHTQESNQEPPLACTCKLCVWKSMLAARQPSFSPLDGVELGRQNKVRLSEAVNFVGIDNRNNPPPS